MNLKTRITLLLIGIGCWACSPSPPENTQQSDTATREAQSDGAARTGQGAIKVDIGSYVPGSIPQGIGEPLKMAETLADEWMALGEGRKVVYQMQVNTGSTEGEWLVTQLMAKRAPEIIANNAEATWPHVSKGWYVPLDEYLEQPNPYVPGNTRWMDLFANSALVNSKRAPDGKLYCVSVDIVETGFFYNKDILTECGLTPPGPDWTWAEMLEMLKVLEDHGYIPMAGPAYSSNLPSDWGQDIIFEMLYHTILPQMDMLASNEAAQEYLEHYLDAPEAGFLFTKGFFTRKDPRWREQYRILREWRKLWMKDLKTMDPDRSFIIKRMGFFWSGSWLIRRMANDPYIDFDWGICYLPRITQETSRFAVGSPATVIGGAGMQYHVTNSVYENDTLDETIDFLQFMTAPRNIERVVGEAMIYIPNVKGANVDPRLEPFNDIFQRKYCAIKWLDSFDGKEKKKFRRFLDYYLNDPKSDEEALEDFLIILEDTFAAWVERHRDDVAWVEGFEKMEKVWQEREAELTREINL